MDRFGAPIILGVSVIIGSAGMIITSTISSLWSAYIGYGIMAGGFSLLQTDKAKEKKIVVFRYPHQPYIIGPTLTIFKGF